MDEAGKRVNEALSSVRRSSGTCSFAMLDLETGADISSSANQVVYGASTIKGPYVTSICKCRASRIDGSAKSHINNVASWSSDDDYKALRSRFGSSPMASFMSYSHVNEISSYNTWVSYSPKTLGKLWVGSYWASFKDSNENSSYLRSQLREHARALDAYESYLQSWRAALPQSPSSDENRPKSSIVSGAGGSGLRFEMIQCLNCSLRIAAKRSSAGVAASFFQKRQ